MDTKLNFILFVYFMEFLRKDNDDSTTNCPNIIFCAVGVLVVSALQFANPTPAFIFHFPSYFILLRKGFKFSKGHKWILDLPCLVFHNYMHDR